MITDKQLLFCDNQSLAAGTSENIVDAGPPDAGVGRDLDLFVTAKGVPAAELAVTLETSPDAAFSASREVATYTVPAETVGAGGKVVRGRLPHGCDRFLRLRFSGAAGGTVSAGIVKDS